MIEIIEIASAFKQREQSKASINFFSVKIEYIELNPPKEINVNESFLRVYVDKGHIILIGTGQMFVFDRKNGQFIREIGQIGRGPHDYLATLHDNAYDYSRKVIIAVQSNPKKYIEYNINGEVITNLNFSCPNVGGISSLVNYSKDSIYTAYCGNLSENKQQRLKLIDIHCNVLKIYYHAFKLEGEPDAFSFGLSKFYKFQDDLMFFEDYCDTIFHVTQESLIPRFVFNWGEFEPPYEKQYDMNYLRGGERDKDFHINKLFESTRYLFIRFSYDGYYLWQGVYDKKKKIILIQEDENGFDNNIDNFVPLKNATSVNNDNELIGFIEAYNVVGWFKTHPEKAAKLPAHLQKFKNISENDSPLIMIMKLKQ